MRKIVIINSSGTYSGIGHYSYDLSKILNCQLYTIIYDNKNASYPGEIVNSFLPRLPGRYKFNIKFQNIIFKKFINNIQNIDHDFIHFSSQEVRPFNSINSSVTIHDVLGITGKNKIIEYNFKIYKNFKNVLSVSNHVKNRLIDLGFDSNIKVIWPGIKNFYKLKDRANIRKELNLPADKILLLSVSDSRQRKNLGFLKELVDKMGDEYKLIRIGSPVGDSITFNNVDSVTLNKIYNACDMMVYPSTEEGFGYPMAEAFMVGLPVVASNIEIFHEVGGKAAYLCDLNIDEFKSGIEEVWNNRDQYAKSSLERSKMFDYNLYTLNVINYFNSLINE